MLNVGTDASDFFQTDRELEKQRLRSKKIFNVLGNPFDVQSKIICMKPLNSPLLEHSPSIILGDGGYMCRIFDPVTRSIVAKFKGHQGPVTCVTYYHDPKQNDTIIFTGSWDKTVIQWSLKNLSKVKQFSFHSQFVKCVALSPNLHYLYSGSQDKTIRKTNLSTGESEVWVGHTMGINEILTLDDFVFSSGSDATIRQWDAKSGTAIRTLRAHETSVHALLVDENDVLWSSSPDKYVKGWSLENLETPECTFDHPDSVKAMICLPGNALATGCRDEKIRIWNIGQNKLIKVVDGHYDEVSGFCIIGSNLYSCSYDGTIRTWSIKELLDLNVKFDFIDFDNDSQNSDRKLVSFTEEEEEELNALMEEEE